MNKSLSFTRTMDNNTDDSNISCKCAKKNSKCLEVCGRLSTNNSALSVETVPQLLDSTEPSSNDEVCSIEHVPQETEDDKSVPPVILKPASETNITADTESSEDISRSGSLHLIKQKNTDIEEEMVEQMEELIVEQMVEPMVEQMEEEIVENDELEVKYGFFILICTV